MHLYQELLLSMNLVLAVTSQNNFCVGSISEDNIACQSLIFVLQQKLSIKSQ